MLFCSLSLFYLCLQKLFALYTCRTLPESVTTFCRSASCEDLRQPKCLPRGVDLVHSYWPCSAQLSAVLCTAIGRVVHSYRPCCAQLLAVLCTAIGRVVHSYWPCCAQLLAVLCTAYCGQHALTEAKPIYTRCKSQLLAVLCTAYCG